MNTYKKYLFFLFLLIVSCGYYDYSNQLPLDDLDSNRSYMRCIEPCNHIIDDPKQGYYNSAKRRCMEVCDMYK